MRLDWFDLLAWFDEAMAIEIERTRSHGIATANGVARLFRKR